MVLSEREIFSSRILDALSKPTALFDVPREFLPFVYQEAYGSYVFSGAFSSQFEITSEQFRTSHDFLVQAFFNFVAANTRAVERGDVERISDLYKAAFAELGEYAPELRTDISSPGNLTITSQYITPLVASVLLALAIAVGAEAQPAVEERRIVIGNSAAPANDPCAAAVREQVYAQLQLLGYDRCAVACERVRAVAIETGISSPAIVKEE